MGSEDITLQIDAFRSLYSVQGYKPQLSVHNLKILWHNPQSRLVTYIHIQRAHTRYASLWALLACIQDKHTQLHAYRHRYKSNEGYLPITLQ